MKRVLITGAGSYIGTSFEKYMNQWPSDYYVEAIDMIDGTWRDKSFIGYDVVFHVAGIAHMKETKENSSLYFSVNRDMAIEVAHKAKREGVRQFVFMSSMSVYGMNIGKISKETSPTPQSSYGQSKLEAEKSIQGLHDEMFTVTILRPPMVYGPGCKGNFQSLIGITRKLPILPYVDNKRSLIFIDNLCSFVKMCIDKKIEGVYFPQNDTYAQTSTIMAIIAEKMGKKVWFSKVLGYAVSVILPFVGIAQKAFGTLIYCDTEEFSYEYIVCEFEESIRKSIAL